MKLVHYLILVAVCALCCRGEPIKEEGRVACNSFCPLNYVPLCGKDNSGFKQTFPNECAMKTENCVKRASFQIISKGPCN